MAAATSGIDSSRTPPAITHISPSTCTRITRAVFFALALIAAAGAILSHVGVLPPFIPQDAYIMAWSASLFFALSGLLLCVQATKRRTTITEAEEVPPPLEEAPVAGEEKKAERKVSLLARHAVTTSFREVPRTRTYECEATVLLHQHVAAICPGTDGQLFVQYEANPFFGVFTKGVSDDSLTRMQGVSSANPVLKLCYDPTTRLLATVKKEAIFIWDTTAKRLHTKIALAENSSVEALALSGTSLMTIGSRMTQFYDFTDPKAPQVKTALPYGFYYINLARGEKVAFSTATGMYGLARFSANDGFWNRNEAGRGLRYGPVTFDSAQGLFYVGASDGNIEVFDGQSSYPLRQFRAFTQSIDALTVSGNLLFALHNEPARRCRSVFQPQAIAFFNTQDFSPVHVVMKAEPPKEPLADDQKGEPATPLGFEAGARQAAFAGDDLYVLSVHGWLTRYTLTPR